MSVAINRRRGTTVQHSTFTGLPGEVTIDTTKKTVVVHDGTTVGGIPLLKEDASNGTPATLRTALGLGDSATKAVGTTAGTVSAGDHAHSGVYEPVDADIARVDVDQAWTGSQRGTPTTDNDASFDLTAANNFTCTPTGSATLTFTNMASATGQSGIIKFVNGSNYTISKAATTKSNTTFLTTVSATGTYIVSYYCDGTDVFVSTDGAAS